VFFIFYFSKKWSVSLSQNVVLMPRTWTDCNVAFKFNILANNSFGVNNKFIAAEICSISCPFDIFRMNFNTLAAWLSAKSCLPAIAEFGLLLTTLTRCWTTCLLSGQLD